MTDSRLQDLMALVASGNEDAFTELYALTHVKVYALAQKVLQNRDLAEEVVQEVFTEIWTHAGNYIHTKGSPMAWINTMTKRRAIDRVRSVSAQVPRDERYGHRMLERPHDEVWEAVSERLSAEDVWQSLSVLSQEQRDVITLAHFGGYSQTQVADMLHISLGTVKHRTRQGHITLRKKMEASP